VRNVVTWVVAETPAYVVEQGREAGVRRDPATERGEIVDRSVDHGCQA
jgi:hypothetical protein